MGSDSNGKEREELVALTLKVPRRVHAAITSILEQGIAEGRFPSQSDVIRDLLVEGLRSRGVNLEEKAA
jgi:Arc/MetJ-type ribon-helix-helix transcriptional regulator